MSAVSPGPAEPLTLAALDIDCERVSAQIVEALRQIVSQELKRRGAVVALSGGIDSSVTAALCVRAFGPAHSIAVLMPEADSDEKTLGISRAVAEALGIEALHQDITPILERRRLLHATRRSDQRPRSRTTADDWKMQDRAAERGRQRLVPALLARRRRRPTAAQTRRG